MTIGVCINRDKTKNPIRRMMCVFQTEAMHPDCALVVQHMKALEDCNHILKQEENNGSSSTGESSALEMEAGWLRRVLRQQEPVSAKPGGHQIKSDSFNFSFLMLKVCFNYRFHRRPESRLTFLTSDFPEDEFC